MTPPWGRLSVNVPQLDCSRAFCTNETLGRITLKMRTIDLDSLEIFRAVVRESGVVRAPALSSGLRTGFGRELPFNSAAKLSGSILEY